MTTRSLTTAATYATFPARSTTSFPHLKHISPLEPSWTIGPQKPRSVSHILTPKPSFSLPSAHPRLDVVDSTYDCEVPWLFGFLCSTVPAWAGSVDGVFLCCTWRLLVRLGLVGSYEPCCYGEACFLVVRSRCSRLGELVGRGWVARGWVWVRV